MRRLARGERARESTRALLRLARPNLDAQPHALVFPVRELLAGRVLVARVELHMTPLRLLQSRLYICAR